MRLNQCNCLKLYKCKFDHNSKNIEKIVIKSIAFKSKSEMK